MKKSDKHTPIKSSIDLIMERLAEKGQKLQALTMEQKQSIADLKRQTQAKIAEVEIFSQRELDQVKDDPAKLEEAHDKRRKTIAEINTRAEEEKERIRGD